MKPNFEKLILKNNSHSLLLDIEGVKNAMNESYEKGIEDGREEVLSWLSKMNHLSDNINYIIEEWKNQKK